MKYQLEITVDEEALKESGMTPIDYIRQEIGQVEKSGLSLDAITPMEPSRAESINVYDVMRDRQQEQIRAFPLQYAFCRRQFFEGLQALGIDSKDPDYANQIYRLGNTGAFYRRSDAPALAELLNNHYREFDKALNGANQDSTLDELMGNTFYWNMYTSVHERYGSGYEDAIASVPELMALETDSALLDVPELLNNVYIEEGEALNDMTLREIEEEYNPISSLPLDAPSYPLQEIQETSGTPFLEPGEDLNQRVTKADWEAFREDNPQARIEHFIMRGDVIATDLVHHLTSKMGPAIYDPLKKTLLQMGSPYDFQKNERGELAPRFFTLVRTEDTWHYQGHCFASEREERADTVYYEPRPMLPFIDEAGRQEYLSLDVHPSANAGELCITASHLVAEAGLMEHYSDVTSFLEPMPYLQAAISPDDIEAGLVGWLDENGFGQITGTCQDELGFSYAVYSFDEDKLKGIDPLCFAAYRDAAQVKHYYFTFGSSENFPYQGGHVEVQAASREEAIQLFRSHYPDRNEGIVNCALIYDQNEWNQMPRDSDRDCHHVITNPGPYAVMFDQEKKEKSPTAQMDKKSGNGKEATMEGTYWDYQGKYQAFVIEAIEKCPQVGYTDNPNMNLFIAANNIYYDLYNNGSCNIRDCYRDDVKEHIKPIFKDFKISRFIKEDYAYAEQFIDRVVEHLQDKSLEYQAFPMWLNHEHDWISLAEPEGERGWSRMVFGDEALQADRLEYWTKDMGYSDVTSDFLKTVGDQPLESNKDDGARERNASLVKSYHFTFGSSEHFPYQGGCVEVHAESRKEAVRLFRSHYPDRLEGIVNCAFIYDQNEWNKTTASRNADHDCHRIITGPGPYEVPLDQEKKEESLQHLMAEAKESASDKNKQHVEQQQDLQARQTKTPPSQER